MIGYLGPRGTYSETAARFFMDKIISDTSQELLPISSILQVLDEVENRGIEIGVVPIENSLEGSIHITLDRLAISPITLRAEVVLPIRHMAFGVAGTVPEEVERVYSHPQALAQCRHTLFKLFPRAKHVDFDSTAGAVEFVAREKSKLNIAVGSAESGQYLDLELLYSDVHDTPGNETRFALISRADKKLSLQSEALASPQHTFVKTSILLALGDDHPGALYEVLRVFAEFGVNLSKLESRPTRKGLGSYHFYIDLIGDTNELSIQQALGKTVGIPGFTMKNIGSYPCFILE